MTEYFSEAFEPPPPAEKITVEENGENRIKISFPTSLGISIGVIDRLLDTICLDLRKKNIHASANEPPRKVPSGAKKIDYELLLDSPIRPGNKKPGVTLDRTVEMIDVARESISHFMELRNESVSHDTKDDSAIIREMKNAQKSIQLDTLPPRRLALRFFGYDTRTVKGLLKVAHDELLIRNIASNEAPISGATNPSYTLTGTKMAGKEVVLVKSIPVDCAPEMYGITQKMLSRFTSEADRQGEGRVTSQMLATSKSNLSEKLALERAIKDQLDTLPPEKKFWKNEDESVTAAKLTQAVMERFSASRLPRTRDNKLIDMSAAIQSALGTTYALSGNDAKTLSRELFLPLRKTVGVGREGRD